MGVQGKCGSEGEVSEVRGVGCGRGYMGPRRDAGCCDLTGLMEQLTAATPGYSGYSWLVSMKGKH